MIRKLSKKVMSDDKHAEYLRYDSRARKILANEGTADKTSLKFGAATIPVTLRAPYICYEECVRHYLTEHHIVLEIGAGTGLHTYALVQTGAHVIASDISEHSLAVLEQRLKSERLQTKKADMEALPFEDETFDIVCSAGSLSYGDPARVNAEILRVLRPGGFFICVDSLNHNPVYRLNRWLHYLREERTKSVVSRVSTIGRIESIAKHFGRAEVRYFGSVSYLMPIVRRIIGQNLAARFSDAVDHLIHVRRSAFKFVLLARGRL